jgi:hypothetical protein
MTPLYNHNSRETAYQVDSYPYGSLRCKIWFWLDFNEKKGFRFCSQTENPKNGRMNAPKMSTYNKFAGCMYLDDSDHVVWTGIHEYSDALEALKFVKNFPHANFGLLMQWTSLKARYCKAILDSGKIFGRPLTENEVEDFKIERQLWTQANLGCQAREADPNAIWITDIFESK